MAGKIQQVLLFALIVLIPSQLSLHFWPAFSLLDNVRIDYLSPTLYLTDLLIITILIIDTPKLKEYPLFKKNFILKILTLGLLVITNIFFSVSPPLSLYRFARLALYILFFLFLFRYKNMVLRIFPWGISLALVWVSILALWQFAVQHSIGGFWTWLGERPLDISMPQVAKINIFSQGLFLRSYATLPHPNALAGYLSVASWLLIYFKRKVFIPTIIVSMITILFTFSRSAILVNMLVLTTFFITRHNLFRALISAVILIGLSLNLFFIGNPFSITERLNLYSKSLLIIKNSPVFGTGLGTFPLVQPSLFKNILYLNFQPVHNIPILLLSELGVIFFGLCIFKLYCYLKSFWSGIPLLLKLTLLVILLLSLNDHYWLTSISNLLLLLFTGFLVIVKSSKKSP